MSIVPVVWWKRVLSYFYEFEIDRMSSELNPELWVSLKQNRFLLNTPNAVYSYEDQYDNFGQAIAHFGPERFRAKEVLLLGLGMASIPHIFEKKYGLELKYTAVEADPAVIELCSMYGLPRLTSSVEIIQADAALWLQQNTQKYDVIMMDVFVDDTIPASLCNRQALEHMRQGMRDDALLLYNVLFANAADRLWSQEFYNDVFLSVFPEGSKLDVGGNWILTYHQSRS